MGERVPEPRPPASGPPKKPLPVRLIVVIAVAAYAILFILVNSDEVEVSFVLFSARLSLVIALGLAFALGLVAGYLIDTLRSRRKRKTAAGAG